MIYLHYFLTIYVDYIVYLNLAILTDTLEAWVSDNVYVGRHFLVGDIQLLEVSDSLHRRGPLEACKSKHYVILLNFTDTGNTFEKEFDDFHALLLEKTLNDTNMLEDRQDLVKVKISLEIRISLTYYGYISSALSVKVEMVWRNDKDTCNVPKQPSANLLEDKVNKWDIKV